MSPIMMEHEIIEFLQVRKLDHAYEIRASKPNSLLGVLVLDLCRCFRNECPNR